MKEAQFFRKLKNDSVQCILCPKNCVIKPDEFGKCNIRKNINGTLYSFVYGKPITIHVDPIEKKPLYHFYPGSKVFSIGTIGCNLKCRNCQNSDIAFANPESTILKDYSPKEIIESVKNSGCKIIAYTYTEPTIAYEYILDIAKLAKKNGIKNIMVSNGFINEDPLNNLCEYMDAANIDLKSFSNDFYKENCDGKLKPVLNSLKILKDKKVWLEITNLIVPGKNDDPKEIEKMAKWIKDNLGENVPLHFSRFFPMYKMQDVEMTPIETLKKAYDIAKKHLNYVYIGNLVTEETNTFCPKCKKQIITRDYDFIINMKDGKCEFCNEKIDGIF